MLKRYQQEKKTRAHRRVCLVARSCPTLLVTLWTVVCQASLSMGFSRWEYWSGLPFPSTGDLPDSGIEPASPVAPALEWIIYHWATRNALSCLGSHSKLSFSGRSVNESHNKWDICWLQNPKGLPGSLPLSECEEGPGAATLPSAPTCLKSLDPKNFHSSDRPLNFCGWDWFPTSSMWMSFKSV